MPLCSSLKWDFKGNWLKLFQTYSACLALAAPKSIAAVTIKSSFLGKYCALHPTRRLGGLVKPLCSDRPRLGSEMRAFCKLGPFDRSQSLRDIRVGRTMALGANTKGGELPFAAAAKTSRMHRERGHSAEKAA